MALFGMFIQIRLLRRLTHCHLRVGFFSLAALWMVLFFVINYNRTRSPLRKQFTERLAIKYGRLQPLREMFANASKVKPPGQRSNPGGSKAASMSNASDLQEVLSKQSVLLLLIVTTAPSKYDRRQAIRETW